MHPELISSLATERRHDLAAQLTTSPAAATAGHGRPRRDPGRMLPRLRVNWTHTTLAAAGGPSRRPGRSWVIVISATRTL